MLMLHVHEEMKKVHTTVGRTVVHTVSVLWALTHKIKYTSRFMICYPETRVGTGNKRED